MTTKCSECGNAFPFAKALQATGQPGSLDCPHCGTQLPKKPKRNYRKSLTLSLVGGGVITPSVFMIMNYFSNGEILFLFYGCLILLSSIAALALNSRDITVPPKKVN